MRCNLAERRWERTREHRTERRIPKNRKDVQGDGKDQANIIEGQGHLPPDFASDGLWCTLEVLTCSLIIETGKRRN